MSTKFLITALGLVSLPAMVGAADLYVSATGKDSNSGVKSSPLASLEGARVKIAAKNWAGKEPVTVFFGDGVYYLPETFMLTPGDSGSEGSPVVYQAVNEGAAVLSGGVKLNLVWQPADEVGEGVFMAKTSDGLEIDQLFIDGRNQRMARYPNYDASKKAEPYQGYSADAFSKERAAGWSNPTGGYIHAMHKASWGGYHYLIKGKDDAGEVTYEGGWQNNRQMGMHQDFRMVENIFEELDAEGEWYHSSEKGILYYKPAADTDLKSARVEVVRLRHLVEFQGSEEEPVEHITFQGFTVRHAARTFMETKEQMLRSDWAIYRGGAFMLTGTESISILDTDFDQVGGNAVFISNYNRGTLVKGCHIHDAGASGVCFVGDPNAVRNPLFEYSEKNDLATIDRTPGPKTNNYPALGVVEDCLIHGIGRVERQPAGVMMDMASEITIRDCSIYDTARSGINIGDGAWGGHLIERCDVFDTVLETHDHGSFNSWGRDRYWRSDQATSQIAVDKEPSLPFLDAVKTTVIRDSRWRCEHGWDIDLDDGSSNYDIYNNLMLSGGLKLREGFKRQAWNNILINNGLSPHVWYNKSNDKVESNIMARANSPLIRGAVTVEGLVDRNLYYQSNEAALKKNREKHEWDVNSVLGDPLFVDPDNGDFSVKSGSPAFDIGFENFPMDQFGVKKPSLKAMARIPSFQKKVSKPRLSSKKRAPAVDVVKTWLGAELRSLKGEDFSAFGTRKEDGGVALSVPPSSLAAKAELKDGDLIQGLNGEAVSDVDEFFKVLSNTNEVSLDLKLVRNQQPLELKVKRSSIVVVETASTSGGFKTLAVPPASKKTVTTSRKAGNGKLGTLVDGKLGVDFGPVFGNGIKDGAYKIDLGSAQSVVAITSWSYRKGSRVGQKVALYGSATEADPGWDLSAYTLLGTIDDSTKAEYTAASLRALEGQELGKFRWIVWAVSPVTTNGGGENTSFQELGVEVSGNVTGK